MGTFYLKANVKMQVSMSDSIKHYWCVNCGYHGNFKIERYRNVRCEDCGYDEVLGLSEEEFKEAAKDRPWIIDDISSEEWKRFK